MRPVLKRWLLNYVAGIKFKVENKGQYTEYLQELEPIRAELGIPLKEAMYPEEKK
jgi:cytochrome c oxidase subunit 5a